MYKSFRQIVAALIATSALAALPAFAQQLELPAPSPAAKVSQRVGLTDIAIEYSSAVNDRAEPTSVAGASGRGSTWLAWHRIACAFRSTTALMSTTKLGSARWRIG